MKTPAGQAELDTRGLRLSQRHRTVLLLVDGRRSEAEVRHIAAQAGVADACFDELVDLGLIELLRSRAGQDAPPAPGLPGQSSPGNVSTPSLASARRAPSTPVPLRGNARMGSPVPAANDANARAGAAEPFVSSTGSQDLETPETDDPAFTRARDILLRMVKTEAPVTGSLTLLRLRRARSRVELGSLVDEVRSHLGTRRSLAAAQTLASVRQLLSPSFDSTQPIA